MKKKRIWAKFAFVLLFIVYILYLVATGDDRPYGGRRKRGKEEIEQERN